MFGLIKKRDSDQKKFNHSVPDFIPIACHYDSHTLLTKNGQLIQMIQINGINSEKISDKLKDLREIIRASIIENVDENNFAFWIHTVRGKTALDSKPRFENEFAESLHDFWVKKNYWDDKYVNKLYISIIYTGANLEISSFQGFLNSLSVNLITKFNLNRMQASFKAIEEATTDIISTLNEFGATRLGLVEKDGQCYSEMLSLYSKVMNLSDNDMILPIMDLSEALSIHQYAVGSSVIEVINGEKKKFASILSIKEYQEVATKELDNFLQLPLEFVVTEVFFFAPKSKAVSIIKHQNDILKISEDFDLLRQKGIEAIIETEDKDGNEFCLQQISITIINDEIKSLNNDVKRASKELSEIGIVHVKEDIDLEAAFWAQLPANFIFLKRMAPLLTNNVASLASLHNFPTGQHEGPWGGEITILRTEKGTPFFFHFHNTQGNGHTSIFGAKKDGKTCTMNFLLAEAMRFAPKICYVSSRGAGEILIKLLGGNWYEFNNEKDLEVASILEFDEQLLHNFFVIACSSEEGDHKEVIASLINAIKGKKSKEELIAIVKDSSIEKPILQLFEYKYYIQILSSIFGGISQNVISGFNFDIITDAAFEKANYPTDHRYVENYHKKLNIHSNIRAGIVYLMFEAFLNSKRSEAGVFTIEGLFEFCHNPFFAIYLPEVMKRLSDNNSILLSTIEIQKENHFATTETWQNFYKSLGSIITTSTETFPEQLDQVLQLDAKEFEKLKSLNFSTRSFIFKQDGKSIALELSLGGFTEILKILSCTRQDVEKFNALVESNKDFTIKELYDALA